MAFLTLNEHKQNNMRAFQFIYILFFSFLITGCGFHLRGSKKPTFNNPNISLSVAQNKKNKRLKEQIVLKLTRLGAVISENTDNHEIMVNKTKVNISNIKLTKHKLVGTLTEVRLILTADVNISSYNKAQRNQKIQTQRSYQLNQATVNTNNAEQDNLVSLMYQEMAEKVSHQIALFEKTK